MCPFGAALNKQELFFCSVLLLFYIGLHEERPHERSLIIVVVAVAVAVAVAIVVAVVVVVTVVDVVVGGGCKLAYGSSREAPSSNHW